MSEKKEITVVAEIEIASPDGFERIQTFSRAWRRTLELPVPVQAQFARWARIEKK